MPDYKENMLKSSNISLN